jgi:signal transduction histidine kinase
MAKRKTSRSSKPAVFWRAFGVVGYVVVLVVGIIGIVNVTEAARGDLLESFRYEVRSAVETMCSNVDTLYDEYQAGRLSYDTARDTAILSVSNGNWNDGRRGFWALDYQGTLLAKVENGDLQQKPGDSVWDWQDADGKYVEQDIIAAAQSGGGFVEFRVSNESVDNSYVAYTLPTKFGFLVDATFDKQYFDEHWSGYVTGAVARSAIAVTITSAAILVLLVAGVMIFRKRSL